MDNEYFSKYGIYFLPCPHSLLQSPAILGKKQKTTFCREKVQSPSLCRQQHGLFLPQPKMMELKKVFANLSLPHWPLSHSESLVFVGCNGTRWELSRDKSWVDPWGGLFFLDWDCSWTVLSELKCSFIWNLYYETCSCFPNIIRDFPSTKDS